MESRRNGPQLSSRHDDDDGYEIVQNAVTKTSEDQAGLALRWYCLWRRYAVLEDWQFFTMAMCLTL